MDTFARFLEIVAEALDEPELTGGQLAERAYMSRYHFDRVVAATAGETPAAFRLRILLERAAYRLSASGDGVLDIAVEAGYASHEAFTRAFAKAFGVPPSVWRTTHLGFTVRSNPGPAFADVVRGPLRLLLSGPASSGARATPDDVDAAGRNRVHLVLDDFDATVERLRAAGLPFRGDTVTGPGGRQTLVADPAGNLIELFEPARS